MPHGKVIKMALVTLAAVTVATSAFAVGIAYSAMTATLRTVTVSVRRNRKQ
jgi:hypothetical protein